jgi:hypothetical protein
MKHAPVKHLWKALDQTSIECVATGQEQRYLRLGWSLWRDFLVLHLPSNRNLFYHLPKVEAGKFGDVVTYAVSNPRQKKGAKKDSDGNYRIELHGGTSTENATQAICRDVFCQGMQNAEMDNLPVVVHTYDSLLCETDENDDGAAERLRQCMIGIPDWCPDFPINAAIEIDNKRYAK